MIETKTVDTKTEAINAAVTALIAATRTLIVTAKDIDKGIDNAMTSYRAAEKVYNTAAMALDAAKQA